MGNINTSTKDYTIQVSEDTKLNERIDSLEAELKKAYFRGKATSIESSNLSGVYFAVDYKNANTMEVLVNRNALEDFVRSIKATNINYNMITNLEDQLKKAKEENRLLKEKMSKEDSLEKVREVYIKQNKEYARLKEQYENQSQALLNSEKKVKSLEQEIEAKNNETNELKKEVYVLKEGVNKKQRNNINEQSQESIISGRKKSLQIRVDRARDSAALILSYTIDGHSVERIKKVLNDFYCISIKDVTIYRAISVRKDEDRERILNLYKGFPDYFSNVSEEELIAWFEKTRIKKLHLLSKEEFIEKYGADKLPDPDKYVSGEYYSQPKQ